MQLREENEQLKVEFINNNVKQFYSDQKWKKNKDASDYPIHSDTESASDCITNLKKDFLFIFLATGCCLPVIFYLDEAENTITTWILLTTVCCLQRIQTTTPPIL
ncbi:hypothetical protein T4D_15133 [Trichinella pseudospiralis]|uniref:Uncharacterized protein n=1 Tax=Trichinella pseudospiralis TaxID=6337 RepID=A0A0V1FHQ9_TRIPS|nr:hypothetical protein T4D_15133 [Trichinella pseudospiralis]